MEVIGVILAGAVLATASALRPVELKPGDRVAMLGDSITAQKSYTRYLETYLELCSGVKDLSFMQFGWPGGTAPHAIERMPDDVLGYRPTVTTVMFGINDGKYKPYSDSIALPYKTNLVTIARMLKAAVVGPSVGARTASAAMTCASGTVECQAPVID